MVSSGHASAQVSCDMAVEGGDGNIEFAFQTFEPQIESCGKDADEVTKCSASQLMLNGDDDPPRRAFCGCWLSFVSTGFLNRVQSLRRQHTD